MEKIGLLDVRIIATGIRNNGRIDEQVLEKSDLSKTGTGRVLDNLASLMERGLIRLNHDKSFQVTNTARQILWNREIPLWVKILRILEISPLSRDRVAEYLGEEAEKTGDEIESLRKSQMVMMSALRTAQGLEQTFEILPEGREELERIKSGGYGRSAPKFRGGPGAEVYELLNQIATSLKSSDADEELKDDVLKKISRIRSKLDI